MMPKITQVALCDQRINFSLPDACDEMACRELIRTWVREVEVADAVYEASAEAISKACSLQVQPQLRLCSVCFVHLVLFPAACCHKGM